MNTDSKTNNNYLIWAAISLLLTSSIFMWLPAINTPYWGDDYSFLLSAKIASESGQPWWSAFWPAIEFKFWRPLSQETWWRFVYDSLGAKAHLAHLANLVLLLFGAASVGVLAYSVAFACKWPQPLATALFAGTFYSGYSLHFLPVHWAAAANSSILVLFTCLTLSAWVVAPFAQKNMRILLLIFVVLFLISALLSKESAALLPILMLLLSFFSGRKATRFPDVLTLMLCVLVIFIWLFLREMFTTDIDPQYDLELSSNVARNIFSLISWVFNIPREALRFIAVEDRAHGIAWAIIVSGPMFLTWILGLIGAKSASFKREFLTAFLFMVVAYIPYLFLAWNSYAYYAAVAVILPTILLAKGATSGKNVILIALLFCVSSWLAVDLSRKLDHPGLIGRAYWAESTLTHLEQIDFSNHLSVAAAENQRFYSIGIAGLAWRLGLPRESISIVSSCKEAQTTCLAITTEGRLEIFESP